MNKNLEHIENRPSWDKLFLEMAVLVSRRSHDAQTQCGCVLVNSDKEIVSTGYNGFIRDIDDSVLPNLRPDKYIWCLHAEHNAILNCSRQGKSTLGLTAYITGEPCLNCYQYMWQAGIRKILYSKISDPKMLDNAEYRRNVEIFKSLTTNGRLEIIELDKNILN